MLQPVALAQIHWLSQRQGGRAEPPPGPLYPTTAQFVDGQETFSVVLRFPGFSSAGDSKTSTVELTLLAPDLLPDVVDQLVPGARLRIKEGRRTVAECQVLSVRTAEVGRS